MPSVQCQPRLLIAADLKASGENTQYPHCEGTAEAQRATSASMPTSGPSTPEHAARLNTNVNITTSCGEQKAPLASVESRRDSTVSSGSSSASPQPGCPPLSARTVVCGSASRAAVAEAARASGLGACVHSAPACLGCYAAVFYLSLQQHRQKIHGDAVAAFRKARKHQKRRQDALGLSLSPAKIASAGVSDSPDSVPPAGPEISRPVATDVPSRKRKPPVLRCGVDSSLSVDSAAVAVAAAAGCIDQTDSRKALLSVTRSMLEIDEEEDYDEDATECCWIVDDRLMADLQDGSVVEESPAACSMESTRTGRSPAASCSSDFSGFRDHASSSAEPCAPIAAPFFSHNARQRLKQHPNNGIRVTDTNLLLTGTVVPDSSAIAGAGTVATSALFYPTCSIADPFAVINALNRGLSVADTLGTTDELDDEDESEMGSPRTRAPYGGSPVPRREPAVVTGLDNFSSIPEESISSQPPSIDSYLPAAERKPRLGGAAYVGAQSLRRDSNASSIVSASDGSAYASDGDFDYGGSTSYSSGGVSHTPSAPIGTFKVSPTTKVAPIASAPRLHRFFPSTAPARFEDTSDSHITESSTPLQGRPESRREENYTITEDPKVPQAAVASEHAGSLARSSSEQYFPRGLRRCRGAYTDLTSLLFPNGGPGTSSHQSPGTIGGSPNRIRANVPRSYVVALPVSSLF